MLVSCNGSVTGGDLTISQLGILAWAGIGLGICSCTLGQTSGTIGLAAMGSWKGTLGG